MESGVKDDTKIAVTAAVNNISLSFGTLLNQIEKLAEDISDADSAKVFAFIRRSIGVIEEKADNIRQTAEVTRGTFSFDSEPEPEKRVIQYETAAGTVSVPLSADAAKIAKATGVATVTKAPAKRGAKPKPAPVKSGRQPRISAFSPDTNPDLETAPVFPNKTTDRTEKNITFLDD